MCFLNKYKFWKNFENLSIHVKQFPIITTSKVSKIIKKIKNIYNYTLIHICTHSLHKKIMENRP